MDVLFLCITKTLLVVEEYCLYHPYIQIHSLEALMLYNILNIVFCPKILLHVHGIYIATGNVPWCVGITMQRPCTLNLEICLGRCVSGKKRYKNLPLCVILWLQTLVRTIACPFNSPDPVATGSNV